MEDEYTPYMTEDTGHPLIKNFAMPKEEIQDNEPSGTKKHTCSITFDAPIEVNEHKMMDYIMGIEDALGAKVVKFSWSLSDNKKV
jgi:hypothetical protein